MTRIRRAELSIMSIILFDMFSLSSFHELHISGVTGLSAAEIRHTHPRHVLISDFINGLPPSLHTSHGRFDFPPS